MHPGKLSGPRPPISCAPPHLPLPAQCAKGTYDPGALNTECLPCTAGSYQPATSATACLACEPAYYCTEGAAAALPCPGGTRANLSLAVMTSEDDCLSCPVGTYCLVGSKEATPCASGTYGDAVGMQMCTSCDAGTFQDGKGETTCKACADLLSHVGPPAGSARVRREEGGQHAGEQRTARSPA